MRIIGALLVFSLLLPGCYFGRSPSAKRTGYVTNGTALVLGSLIVAGAIADNNKCGSSDFVTDCSAAGAMNAIVGTLGAIIAGVGLIGVGVNVAVPTEPEPKQPRQVTGRVTAPGLKPATIHLH